MASADFIREKAFLTYILNNPTRTQTNAVLENINSKQSKLISEIFLNFLKGNCKNSAGIVAKHKRFKEAIRSIGSQTEPLSKRKQLIQLHKAKVGAFLKDLKPEIEILMNHNEEVCIGGTGKISEIVDGSGSDIDTDTETERASDSQNKSDTESEEDISESVEKILETDLTP